MGLVEQRAKLWDGGTWWDRARARRFLSTASPGPWLWSTYIQWVPRGLLLLQFLGRYEAVIFYWPSLLCLSFLLGRFLHMFVKSLRVRLGWELQMVSRSKSTVCVPTGLVFTTVLWGWYYYYSSHSVLGNVDPKRWLMLPKVTYIVCSRATTGTQTICCWGSLLTSVLFLF